MTVRTMVVGLALGLVAVGCGDPMADKLESSGKQPYSDSGLDLDGVGPDAAPETTNPDPEDEKAMARWTFVAEGNRLCEERGEASYAAMRGIQDPSRVLGTLRQLVATLETEAALLAGLTPPPGDEAVVAEIVGGYGHITGMFRSVLSAGGYTSEEQKQTFLRDVETAGATHSARLDAYGLTSCF